MTQTPERNPELDAYDIVFLRFLYFCIFVIICVALYVYYHCVYLTPGYDEKGGIGYAVTSFIDNFDTDTVVLGEGELPQNQWGSTHGLIANMEEYTRDNSAVGCLLVPSLDGPKFIPVVYKINPDLNTIYEILDSSWLRLDDDLDARFKKTCASPDNPYI
jgi:hypothetical protein